MSNVITVTSENFESEVLNSEKPVLVDFWASWCGPCRMLAPVLEEIGTEYPEVAFGKVNVDKEAGLAQMFGIVSIPTLVFMKNGKIIKKSVGYLDADGLRAVLDGLI